MGVDPGPEEAIAIAWDGFSGVSCLGATPGVAGTVMDAHLSKLKDQLVSAPLLSFVPERIIPSADTPRVPLSRS
jgi:hypothetical protein